MTGAGTSRRDLIKNVWPDKALFAATLLLITALLGFIHSFAFAAFDITVGERIPWLLRAYPPEAVALLSAVEAVGAWLALKRQRTDWALAAAVAGIVSFSIFGLGTLLAVVALAFVLIARREGEDVAVADAVLGAGAWPDKALAASVVLVVSGVFTLAWGVANQQRVLEFSGYMDQATFGVLCVGAGLLCLVAAALLYNQQGPAVGVVASVASVLGLALYVVGPLLGIAALVLIRRASREGEFDVAEAEAPARPA